MFILYLNNETDGFNQQLIDRRLIAIELLDHWLRLEPTLKHRLDFHDRCGHSWWLFWNL